MAYGFEVRNAQNRVILSTQDRVLAVKSIHQLNGWQESTSWRAYDYVVTNGTYGHPNEEHWKADGTFHWLYGHNLPSGISIEPGDFIGFSCPYGKTIFVRDLYSGARFIRSDSNTLTMCVASLIKPTDNPAGGYGIVCYDDAGDIAYHSGSKVLNVVKRVDGSNSIANPDSNTPYMFMTGNDFFHRTNDNFRALRVAGIRIDSAFGYRRRVLATGSSLNEDRYEFNDPLKNAFIGLVDHSLFAIQ